MDDAKECVLCGVKGDFDDNMMDDNYVHGGVKGKRITLDDNYVNVRVEGNQC
jgi:hypothetical protein